MNEKLLATLAEQSDANAEIQTAITITKKEIIKERAKLARLERGHKNSLACYRQVIAKERQLNFLFDSLNS